MTDPAYSELERLLGADGIRCHFQSPGQFVISTQVGPVWPDYGNSFWVTHAGGKWHLFTWAPVGYLLPDPTHIADLCRALMNSSDRASSVVPASIVSAFGLSEVSDDEAEGIYKAMTAG